MRYSYLVLLVVLFFSSHSSIADGEKIKKIGMSEGLSLNSALCLMQDHQGIIWIGTSDGLNKYNGVDNLIYRYDFDDSLSISNNQINCLFEDSHNNIWVGTANGLNQLNAQNNFTKYYSDNSDNSLPNRYVKCITETQDENIWVGTSDGFSIYNPETSLLTTKRIRDFASNTNNIISLYQDHSDRLWACTKGGLFASDDLNFFSKITLNPEIETDKDQFEIRDITQQSNGTYWMATENYGLFSFRFENGHTTHIQNFNTANSKICSNQIRKLRIIGSQLWYATLDGLGTIDTQTYHIQKIQWSSLSESSFHDILEDNNGGIWIASYLDGVVYYHKQNNLFPHVKQSTQNPNSLSDNSITGFLDDGAQGYWISTGNGGLNYYDQTNHQFTHFTKKDIALTNNIKAMTYDRKRNLWLGTFNGLVYYDRQSGDFTYYQHEQDNPNSLIQNQIHSLHVDTDGLLWIGTNGGGLQTYDPKNRSFQTVNTTFFNLRTIFEDSQNRVWVGSTGSLECIDRLSKQKIDISSLTEPYTNKLTYVNCIYEDSDHRLFIGTQNNGLFILQSEHLFWFHKNNGLASNTVNAVLESNEGDFWISSNNGLARVTLAKDLSTQKQIIPTNFNVSNGLQNLQFEPKSAMKSYNGKLFFGGVNGFNTFFSRDILKENYYPPVVLSELRITDQESINTSYTYPLYHLKLDSTIILEYNERNLLIKFAGINYINPQKLYYRYSLNDNINAWVDLQNQRSINITYLPIGTHELKLKSSSEQDNWGDDFTSIHFKVLPPFWKTWWAYTFYILLMALLLYLFFDISIRWGKLKSNLNMEQFQREKENELHESKLRFFTDMSHELRTPLTLILAPVENIINQSNLSDRFKNQLAMIQRNGNRMTQLINQLLDFRKLETGNDNLKVAQGNIVAFIKEICLAFDGISESKNIDFDFDAERPDLPIWFDRDKIEIVFFNLLSNAFKYTPRGGKIQLQITTVNQSNLPPNMIKQGHEGGVKITISDTGHGISKEDLDNIFERYFSIKGNLENHQTGIGLELAKRMIQLHLGHIFVQSQVETQETSGFTTFIIYLLNGKNHFADQDIMTDFKNSEDVSQYTKDFILREKQIESIETDLIENQEKHKPQKQTILVVEDNTEVRQFIIELLSSSYNIIEAKNGKEGLKQAIDLGPDLIISDVMMPEMNGIDLCKQIKQDSRISHTPIILLTARTAITFKYEGYETGADEYITKPFSASYLTLRVKNLLKQRERLQSHFRSESILEPAELSVTSVDEKLLKKAIDYISKHIEKTDITVNELSHELGLSRVHFYRKMKALTNMTAVEFIRSIRLRTACRLLEQGKFNIKEVKNLVGFENADYFRKCFKETYNMTPSEYAEKFTNQKET